MFETVFWDPRDTESLRKLLREKPLVRDKTVLEIGTGSGLLALSCLRAGAQRVVATDINPAAVANAALNARRLGLADRLETRLVPPDQPGAFSVIRKDEKFDVILSNPPWEDGASENVAELAFFDSRFALLDSLIAGLKDHLTPTGRAYLAYGSVTAIRRLEDESDSAGFQFRILDDRVLAQLPEVFVPGMLVELSRP